MIENYSELELRKFFRNVQRYFETSTEYKKAAAAELETETDLNRICKNLEWYILAFLENVKMSKNSEGVIESKITEKVRNIQIAEFSIEIWKDEVFELEEKILARNIRV